MVSRARAFGRKRKKKEFGRERERKKKLTHAAACDGPNSRGGDYSTELAILAWAEEGYVGLCSVDIQRIVMSTMRMADAMAMVTVFNAQKYSTWGGCCFVDGERFPAMRGREVSNVDG